MFIKETNDFYQVVPFLPIKFYLTSYIVSYPKRPTSGFPGDVTFFAFETKSHDWFLSKKLGVESGHKPPPEWPVSHFDVYDYEYLSASSFPYLHFTKYQGIVKRHVLGSRGRGQEYEGLETFPQ
jgi:hypothetical protein